VAGPNSDSVRPTGLIAKLFIYRIGRWVGVVRLVKRSSGKITTTFSPREGQGLIFVEEENFGVYRFVVKDGVTAQ